MRFSLNYIETAGEIFISISENEQVSLIFSNRFYVVRAPKLFEAHEYTHRYLKLFCEFVTEREVRLRTNEEHAFNIIQN